MKAPQHQTLFAFLVISLAVLIGCGGGGGGGAGNLNLSNVKTESGSARSAVITPEGGNLSVTDSKGVVYTLTIPEGALLRPTEIGMVPVTELTPIAGAGPLAAGVHFTPEGQQFQVRATLTMQLPSGVDPKPLLPVSYERNAEDPHLDVAVREGQKVTMSVRHFSGKVLAPGVQLIDLLKTPVDTVDEKFYQHQMNVAYILFVNNGIDPRAEFTKRLKDWYINATAGALSKAGADQSTREDIGGGITAYDAWLDGLLFAQVALLDASFTVEPELSDSEVRAVKMLKRSYQRSNDLCFGNPNGDVNATTPEENPLLAAGSARYLVRHYVDLWRIPAAENGLDEQTLLDNLCAKVVIEEITAGALETTSPEIIVKAGYKIAGGPIRGTPVLKVEFLPAAGVASYSPTSDTTGPANRLATSIATLAGNPSQIVAKVKACIRHDDPFIRVLTKDICRSDQKSIDRAPGAITVEDFPEEPVQMCSRFFFEAKVTGTVSDKQLNVVGAKVIGFNPNTGTTFLQVDTSDAPGDPIITLTSAAQPSLSVSLSYHVDQALGVWRAREGPSAGTTVVQVTRSKDGTYTYGGTEVLYTGTEQVGTAANGSTIRITGTGRNGTVTFVSAQGESDSTAVRHSNCE
jgi:hypothetical protein